MISVKTAAPCSINKQASEIKGKIPLEGRVQPADLPCNDLVTRLTSINKWLLKYSR